MWGFSVIWEHIQESIQDGIQEVKDTVSGIKQELSWEAKEKRSEFLRDLNQKIESLSSNGKITLLYMLKLTQEDWWDRWWTISDATMSDDEKNTIHEISKHFQDWFVSVWDNIKDVELNLELYIQKLERDIQQEKEENQAEELKDTLKKSLIL